MMGLGSSFGGDSAPPPLDLSEFPSLTSRTSETSQQNTNPMVGRQPYGNCLFGQGKMRRRYFIPVALHCKQLSLTFNDLIYSRAVCYCLFIVR